MRKENCKDNAVSSNPQNSLRRARSANRMDYPILLSHGFLTYWETVFRNAQRLLPVRAKFCQLEIR